jgi:hypothetical protein
MDEQLSRGQANPLTLAALGILAYVMETVLHEAGGHGSVCLLTQGHITMLAPLFMRCSVQNLSLVAAGPAMNGLVTVLSLIALHIGRPAGNAVRYFIWLCLVFNGLVAAGYLMVGAATGFGDWGVVFAGVQPDWHWRVPGFVIGLLAYIGLIEIAKREFRRLGDLHSVSRPVVMRLVLVPAGAAAIVAVAAQWYGHGLQMAGLALACTLGVGVTLLGIVDPKGTRTIKDSALHIGLSVPAIVLALAVAAGFILWIGPGADLSAL